MEILRSVIKARKSISSFCIEECKAYCCRKGYLVLQGKEIKKVLDNDYASSTTKNDGTVSLNLNDNGCPQLKDNKCKIHKSKNRPKTCGDFPVYLYGNTIFLSPRCLAVRENKMYAFIHLWKEKKFRVVQSTSETPEMNHFPLLKSL